MYLDESSDAVKQLAKFEQFHSKYTPGDLKPGNPWKFRPFPAMLWREQETPNGKSVISQQMPRRSQFVVGMAGDEQYVATCDEIQRFNDSCQMIVHDERERSVAFEAGWRATPQDAKEFREQREFSIAQMTANRNHQDKNMGERAKSEATTFEQDNFGHQPEIPAQRSLKTSDVVMVEGKKIDGRSKAAREARKSAAA